MGGFHSLGAAALAFQKDPTHFTEKISAIGGTHLFASNPTVLNSETQTVCTNDQGMPLFFQEISPPKQGPYPHLKQSFVDASLTQESGGLFKPGFPTIRNPADQFTRSNQVA